MYSGFPVWLKYVPGISFRTDNEPFKVCLVTSSTVLQSFMFLARNASSKWQTTDFAKLKFDWTFAESNARVHCEDCQLDEERKPV